MAGLPVLNIPLNNAAAPQNAAAVAAQARLRAGPQYNTATNGPWQRHTNDTGILRDANGQPVYVNGIQQGINWDKPGPGAYGTAWSTKPQNYRIPTNPNLQPTPLHPHSPQADVNLFLGRLEASTVLPGAAGAAADARLRAANLRPKVHAFEVSSRDADRRRRIFHYHRHPNTRPDERFFGPTQACPGGPNAGCMPLNEYSDTCVNLAAAIRDHGSRGGLLALVASEQQPAGLWNQAPRQASILNAYGPGFTPPQNMWHSVAILAVHIPQRLLPDTVHAYSDLLTPRNRRSTNPLVDTARGEGLNADIRRIFIYDPSYPNFGAAADLPPRTLPGNQPRQSRFRNHLFLQNVVGVLDYLGERNWAGWVRETDPDSRAGNVFIGGGGNTANTDDCLRMSAAWVEQMRQVQASLLDAIVSYRQHQNDVGYLAQYHARLEEFADMVCDFDPIW